MGRQKKSCSWLSIFKSCCWDNGKDDDISEDGYNYGGRRICQSDEDGRRWMIADPWIDGRASAFIARFYESRVSDPDRQTLAL